MCSTALSVMDRTLRPSASDHRAVHSLLILPPLFSRIPVSGSVNLFHMTAAQEDLVREEMNSPVFPAGLDTPTVEDGAAIWRIARDSQTLDLNSSYSYLLWCRDFARTSVVARDDRGEA